MIRDERLRRAGCVAPGRPTPIPLPLLSQLPQPPLEVVEAALHVAQLGPTQSNPTPKAMSEGSPWAVVVKS